MNSKHSGYLCLALLLLTTIAAYFNMPGTEFIGDDIGRILKKENAFKEGLAYTLENVLSDRPVMMVTIWLNYIFGGTNPVGYKLFNVLLHLACGFAVFALMKELFRDFSNKTLYAFSTAALFLSHPINNQAVNSVIQRGVGLSTLFSLLSMLALIFYVKRGFQRHHYLLSILAFLLAIGSKANTAVLPLIAALYLIFELKVNWKHTFKIVTPYLIILLLPAILHALFTENAQFTALSSRDYFLVQVRVIAFYFQKYFVPLNLQFYYDFNNQPKEWINAATPYFFILHLGLIAAASYFYFKKQKITGLFVIFGYIALLPESGFFPIIHTAFDHRNYFPFIFFAASLVGLFAESLKERLNHSFFTGAIFLTVACLSFLNARYTDKISTYHKWVSYNIEMNPSYRRFYSASITHEMQNSNFEMAGALIAKVKAANPTDEELDFLQNLLPFNSQADSEKLETLRKSFEFACSKGLTTDSFYYFEYLLAKNLSNMTSPKDYLYKMNSYYFCFINVVFQPYIAPEVRERVETNFMTVLEANQRLHSDPDTFFDGMSVSEAMITLRTLIALNHYRGYGQVDIPRFVEILRTRFKDASEVQGVLNFVKSLYGQI